MNFTAFLTIMTTHQVRVVAETVHGFVVEVSDLKIKELLI